MFSKRCKLFRPLALGTRSEFRTAWLMKCCLRREADTLFTWEPPSTGRQPGRGRLLPAPGVASRPPPGSSRATMASSRGRSRAGGRGGSDARGGVSAARGGDSRELRPVRVRAQPRFPSPSLGGVARRGSLGHARPRKKSGLRGRRAWQAGRVATSAREGRARPGTVRGSDAPRSRGPSQPAACLALRRWAGSSLEWRPA